ncbi:winged helix-turn-helix domain-containing protein [Micromonospora krabiensis]|uniref:Transcriptional regulatory protein, C terminal n=1 Tax=Micromonospora krabiensis TaxID=307121 RepID=A0A1C3N9T7_9ACTN|nr:winged helix-turn-helix domain-containing protein [Micromonospora krabiensis]SBV29357.1 Transcriptional regulatory protein, C terminal [Micromonospora krabiensis]
MSREGVPIVVCVSADVAVRERVVRRLDGVAPVVSCADLTELRAVLFAPQVATAPTEDPTPVAPADECAGAPDDPPDGPVGWGDLLVDRVGHLVTWRGEPLALTRTEREILARLISPPISVWTYERLFAAVWGGDYLGDAAVLHSAVKRLRHKLRPLPGGPRVHTVRGVGYRLDAAPPSTAG